MSTFPLGIYMEKEKKFEFDFVTHLLKISFFKESKLANTIVSPFRMIKNEDQLFLLIHDYDRTGERRIQIESMDQDELVICHDNTSYKLQKIRTN